MRLALLLLFGVAAAYSQEASFEATLERTLAPNRQGRLLVSEEGIEFQPVNEKKDTLKWRWVDIQRLDRISPVELRLLTYEDFRWRLYRDRERRFTLTMGEIGDTLFERMTARLSRPATDRAPAAPEEPAYEIAVKHLHALGGCDGRLLFQKDRVVYETTHRRHSRGWRLGEHVISAWSSDAYALELHVREPGGLDEIDAWRFQLKHPLDAAYYRALKLQLYELERGGEVSAATR